MDALVTLIKENYFFFTILLFIFGACVGSFLNVCILRLPQEGASVVKPASHCFSCKKSLAWYDNIPVISYIWLQGNCRYCGVKLSPQYIIIEVLTGYIFVDFYNRFGCSPEYIGYTYLVCSLLVATIIDIRYQIIPDEINYAGMIVGLLLSALFPSFHGVDGYLWGALHGLIGILVGGGIVYLVAILGDLAFRKESMGGGDIKFMAMMGAFLGWKLVLIAFFVAPFLGTVVGLYVKFVRKEEIIPYGPFLSLAAVVSIFGGEWMIQRLFGGF